MKNKKLKYHSETKTSSASTASKYVLSALAAVAVLPVAVSSSHAEDAPPDKVHALLNFEFSDHYLTPRGMIVQDSGLVFQPLVLGFFNLYGSKNFSATLVGGVWNCFGTDGIPSSDSGGTKKTSWYEIDPIAGLSFGFCKNFTLDVTYTAFDMQILNIPFSQHLETKLSFNDSPYLKALALHPYVSFWKELEGKAVASYSTKSSYYFDIGFAPSYTFEKINLKLEAPCRMLLPDSEFYGDNTMGGVAPSSTVALYELGIKGTVPLKFMPKGYGSWSFHAGFKYMNFVDENLQRLANGGGFGQSTKDVKQVYCGISTFF
ncbi:MAG: hypothetical protein QOD03_734 [Verrucomicrobiota bacterium]|jgi:hypothetical protein